MLRDISPEERLLRLIRQDKKVATSQDITPAPREPTQTLKPALKEAKLKYPKFQLPQLKGLIFALLLLTSLYLLSSLLWPFFFVKEINPKPSSETKAEPIKEEPPTPTKPYSFYQDTVAKRQIFGSALAESTKSSLLSQGVVASDIVKDLNLLGIISGENPQAILEDKKTQKTYYLSKGQFMGELQVEDIQEGKIILNYQGQRFELYL